MRRWLFGLLCLLAAPAALRAQGLADYDYENLSFRGASLDYGYIWPSKVQPTSRYGVRFDLGFLGPGVRITPSLSYWNSKMKEGELNRLAGRLGQLPPFVEQGVTIEGKDLGAIDWRDLALQLDGQYAWETPVGVMPYLGLGVGAHFLNGRGELIKGTFIEDLLDTVTAGLTGLAGVEYEPLPRFRVYAEASYTLMSYLRYPSLKIGGALMVAKGRGGNTP